MENECRSIYKAARFKAGITQEVASELLHISMKSISDYERGKTIPPDDVVCNMVTLYQAPWLAYVHLKTNNEVGKLYLPNIKIKDLSCSVLDLQYEIEGILGRQSDIVSVGRDNRIDTSEQIVWNECMLKVDRLAGAAFQLLFAPQTEKTPVREHRRFLEIK